MDNIEKLQPNKLSEQPNLSEEKIPVKIELEPEKEISPEAIKDASRVIFETLEIDPDSEIDYFQNKLLESIKTHPRYRELQEKIKNVPPENLIYELFKNIKEAADSDSETEKAKNLSGKNLPDDGVLIKSMRQGKIRCSGRSMIASTFLSEHGIKNSIAGAPFGDTLHSFMIIETDKDSLAYFDAENNLYFSFPKEALTGYKDANTSSISKIKEYTPRDKDVTDGIGMACKNFYTIPSKEGISRQYLSNIKSALKELDTGEEDMFVTSGIARNPETAEAAEKIEHDLLGENSTLKKFYQQDIEALIKKSELEKQSYQKTIYDLFNNSSKEKFIYLASEALMSNLGEGFPYLKNAPKEKRVEAAEKAWEYLNSRK